MASYNNPNTLNRLGITPTTVSGGGGGGGGGTLTQAQFDSLLGSSSTGIVSSVSSIKSELLQGNLIAAGDTIGTLITEYTALNTAVNDGSSGAVANITALQTEVSTLQNYVGALTGITIGNSLVSAGTALANIINNNGVVATNYNSGNSGVVYFSSTTTTTMTLNFIYVVGTVLIFTGSLATSAGLTLNTPYYIVSVSNYAVQLSNTNGGSPITLSATSGGTSTTGAGTAYFANTLPVNNPTVVGTLTTQTLSGTVANGLTINSAPTGINTINIGKAGDTVSIPALVETTVSSSTTKVPTSSAVQTYVANNGGATSTSTNFGSASSVSSAVSLGNQANTPSTTVQGQSVSLQNPTATPTSSINIGNNSGATGSINVAVNSQSPVNIGNATGAVNIGASGATVNLVGTVNVNGNNVIAPYGFDIIVVNGQSNSVPEVSSASAGILETYNTTYDGVSSSDLQNVLFQLSSFTTATSITSPNLKQNIIIPATDLMECCDCLPPSSTSTVGSYTPGGTNAPTNNALGWVMTFAKYYARNVLKPGRKLLIVNNGFGATGFAERSYGCDPVGNASLGYDSTYQTTNAYMCWANWNATTTAGITAANNLPTSSGISQGTSFACGFVPPATGVQMSKFNSLNTVGTKTYKNLYEMAVQRITTACGMTYNNLPDMANNTSGSDTNYDTITSIPANFQNQIVAFLWHQGENETATVSGYTNTGTTSYNANANRSSISATNYASCLEALIDAFRGQSYNGVSGANVPWICGGFTNYTYQTIIPYPTSQTIYAYLARYGTTYTGTSSGSPRPYTGFVKTVYVNSGDPTTLAYQISTTGAAGPQHFTFTSYRIMGQRYFTQYQYALTNTPTPATISGTPTVSVGSYQTATNTYLSTFTFTATNYTNVVITQNGTSIYNGSGPSPVIANSLVATSSSSTPSFVITVTGTNTLTFASISGTIPAYPTPTVSSISVGTPTGSGVVMTLGTYQYLNGTDAVVFKNNGTAMTGGTTTVSALVAGFTLPLSASTTYPANTITALFTNALTTATTIYTFTSAITTPAGTPTVIPAVAFYSTGSSPYTTISPTGYTLTASVNANTPVSTLFAYADATHAYGTISPTTANSTSWDANAGDTTGPTSGIPYKGGYFTQSSVGYMNYNGTHSTSVSGTTVLGNYATLQIPSPKTLTQYQFYPIQLASQIPSQWASAWVLAGSNDGTTWSLIDKQGSSSTAIACPASISTPISVLSSAFTGTNASYSYFRIIITQGVSTGVSGYAYPTPGPLVLTGA